MKHRTNQQGSAAVYVVLAIVILALLGIGIKLFSNKDDNMSSKSSASSLSVKTDKASDFRADMVTLGVSHMLLTDTAVDDALGGTKDANASAAALYKNGTDIGAAVGSVYGKDAETTFNTVWKLHLDQFVAYAVADSKADETGKKAALDTIDSQYTKPLAQFLAKANPNLPEATLETALRDHVSMTAGVIDDHVAGNYTMEQTDLAKSVDHMRDLFSTLSTGIVKQYPAKFQD